MATLEQKLDVALWWKQMRETNNARFLPLLFDKHRFLVLKGGGGSGKSIFAGRKILERVTNEPGHRYLVVRKVAKTLRESCFEQLKKQAYEYYADQIAFIPKGKGSDMYIRFKNGSEILFAGLDDVEKLKSIFDITGIWIEEASELEEGDFNQLDIRLRTEFPFYLQMILTFNPISITHWLKKRFFDTKDPRATVHESTYKDNRFLTPEARITLEAFRETDEYYYMVYCLGQWGVTGKTVFNGKAVAERLTYVEKQGWRKRKDTLALKQALSLLLTINRTPQLYYGTEVLMNGTKSVTDGNVRKDFPGGWAGDKHNAFTAEGRTQAENQMFNWLSNLLHWRQGNEVITKGKQTQFCPQKGVYVIARQYKGKNVMTVINGKNEANELNVSRYAEIIGSHDKATDVTNGRTVLINKNVKLRPRQSMILEF